MAIQISTLRTNFEQDLKKDISDVGEQTFIDWCNFITRFAYRSILNVDPERFIDETNTYTVSSAPQTSSLPSDFRDISRFNTGFFRIDDNGLDTTVQLSKTGFGSRNPGYYIKQGNVIFTGISNSDQYRLRYIPKLTTYTATGDYLTLDGTASGLEVIPDEYTENVIKALDVLYSQWDEDPNAEAIADQRFIRALSDLLGTINQDPTAYAIPEISSYY